MHNLALRDNLNDMPPLYWGIYHIVHDILVKHPFPFVPSGKKYLTWYSNSSWSKKVNRLTNIMTWCSVSNPRSLGISLYPILLPWDKKSLPIGWIPYCSCTWQIVSQMGHVSPGGSPHGHHSGPWCTALLSWCIYNAEQGWKDVLHPKIISDCQFFSVRSNGPFRPFTSYAEKSYQ